MTQSTVFHSHFEDICDILVLSNANEVGNDKEYVRLNSSIFFGH